MTVPNESYRDHIPNGWGCLFDELLDKLGELDPDFQICQAKQKFGELRVYLDHYVPGASDLVDAASRESKTTCEECGGPAILRVEISYYRTLCDNHSGAFVPAEKHPILASFRISRGKVELRDV